MNKTGGGGFCLNRIRANVRVQSPTIQSSHELNSIDEHGTKEKTNKTDVDRRGGRRIMVVVDSSSEAKNALLWTLSHCAQQHDTILLFHFLKINPSKTGTRRTSRAYERTSTLKNICHLKTPQMKVEVVMVEGEEKGQTIVKEARAQGAALLVLGQKKQSTTWRLVMIWAGQSRPINANDVVEYCINHSPCMAIAVRKRSKKLGGYTITTKRHKDFWLLA